jgi:hypothetical protein
MSAPNLHVRFAHVDANVSHWRNTDVPIVAARCLREHWPTQERDAFVAPLLACQAGQA